MPADPHRGTQVSAPRLSFPADVSSSAARGGYSETLRSRLKSTKALCRSEETSSSTSLTWPSAPLASFFAKRLALPASDLQTHLREDVVTCHMCDVCDVCIVGGVCDVGHVCDG